MSHDRSELLEKALAAGYINKTTYQSVKSRLKEKQATEDARVENEITGLLMEIKMLSAILDTGLV